jgi:hypothetical protein
MDNTTQLPMSPGAIRAMAKRLMEMADAIEGSGKSKEMIETSKERVIAALQRAPKYSKANPYFAYFLDRCAMTRSLLIRALGNGPTTKQAVDIGLAELIKEGVITKLPNSVRAHRRGRNPDFYIMTKDLHLFEDENGTLRRSNKLCPDDSVLVKSVKID